MYRKPKTLRAKVLHLLRYPIKPTNPTALLNRLKKADPLGDWEVEKLWFHGGGLWYLREKCSPLEIKAKSFPSLLHALRVEATESRDSIMWDL